MQIQRIQPCDQEDGIATISLGVEKIPGNGKSVRKVLFKDCGDHSTVEGVAEFKASSAMGSTAIESIKTELSLPTTLALNDPYAEAKVSADAS